MKTKVSVEEAFEIIRSACNPLPITSYSVEDSLGFILAEDIYAPISLPPFDNSSVDGYAIIPSHSEQITFEISGTLAAGGSTQTALSPGQALQIMTGAKIPSNTFAVVMQEDVLHRGNCIELSRKTEAGANIRRAGEDIEKGECVGRAGKKIASRHIGVLSALGLTHLQVFERPKVSIVSTGSELIDPGNPLGENQVYFCTGAMMNALAVTCGAEVAFRAKVKDDEEEIFKALKEASRADVILMVGGMAEGKFDFGRASFERLGVSGRFFEGQWRPGKPLFFGTMGSKLVFGLPGNPVAAFVMFKVFIEPALCALSGEGFGLRFKKGTLCSAPKQTEKAQFLRVLNTHGNLEILPGQGSHQLYSLSKANAIAWIPALNSQNRPNEVYYLTLEA